MRALFLIALSLPSFAQSPPLPAAPQVTVGTPQLKVLQFNWLPVPGATHYLLQYKPNAASTFAPYGNPILAPRTLAGLTIPVHAFDWVNARFKVSACNAAGCQDSAEISVQDQMLTSIGYIKASYPDRFDIFGGPLVLSQDGNTLVTSALEDSSASGVNGDQEDNSAPDTGAVYVFRRIGVGWRQEAYLKSDAGARHFGLSFRAGMRAISVSADGSVVAVGARGESVDGLSVAGMVYLFTRAADGTWSQTQKIPPLFPQFYGEFGVSVDLSDDASVLKVIQLDPEDPDGLTERTTYIFRNPGTGWVYDTTLPRDENANEECASQMSGNATVIIELCLGQTSSHLLTHRRSGANWAHMSDIRVSSWSTTAAVSGNGARAAVASNDHTARVAQVQVFARVGNQWVVEQYIAPPPGAVTVTGVHYWGSSVAFNRNGTMLAIADGSSTIVGAGVSDTVPALSDPSSYDGAVYVYQRGESGWSLLKVVKAPNPQYGDAFGGTVALSGSGLTLAVGALGEDSAARGIDGDQADNSKDGAGAVYLY